MSLAQFVATALMYPEGTATDFVVTGGDGVTFVGIGVTACVAVDAPHFPFPLASTV
jgi:hypothetical protein